MKIKLCGFSEPESIRLAINCGCDFIGVVFAKKSIRYVDPKKSQILASAINDKTSKVAVVVDQTLEELATIQQNFSPNFFQLHGSENLEYISQVKNLFPSIQLIKALVIADIKDFEQISTFQNHVDYFLFDNKIAGSGQSFDWDFLSAIDSPKPWFLSGGINISNIENAISKTKTQFIDISSGIEETRGSKSNKLIIEIMQKFNQLKIAQKNN